MAAANIARESQGLARWFVVAFHDRMIAVDSVAAAPAGQLAATAMAAGRDPGMADAMIAGVAAAHGAVVVTRNSWHFADFGADVVWPEGIAGFV